MHLNLSSQKHFLLNIPSCSQYHYIEISPKKQYSNPLKSTSFYNPNVYLRKLFDTYLP
nr:MAG TPA: hypothetical protein [Caudoviricetes sp.]